MLESLLDEVAGLQPATLSKKRLRSFPLSFGKKKPRHFQVHLQATVSGRALDFSKTSANSY